VASACSRLASSRRSLRHRRRIARVRLRPEEMVVASSAPIRNLESALAALTENAAIDWLDLTMRHLSQISDQQTGAIPTIRLVRVGADGVDLFLADASGVPRVPSRSQRTDGPDSSHHDPPW